MNREEFLKAVNLETEIATMERHLSRIEACGDTLKSIELSSISSLNITSFHHALGKKVKDQIVLFLKQEIESKKQSQEEILSDRRVKGK